MKYFAIISALLGDILFDELGFGSILYTKVLTKFMNLMGAVVPIARIVSIFKSKTILGGLNEEKD